MDLEIYKLEHIVVIWQLKWISLFNWWSMYVYGTSYFDIFLTRSLLTVDELISDMENGIIFTACSSIFYISPTQNLQFFGTLFLLFFVLLIPSLTVFVSLRQRRWQLLSTISQQYRWFPRCVSAHSVLSFVYLFITGLCTIYLCDAHCACHEESFFIVNCKEPAL